MSASIQIDSETLERLAQNARAVALLPALLGPLADLRRRGDCGSCDRKSARYHKALTEAKRALVTMTPRERDALKRLLRTSTLHVYVPDGRGRVQVHIL